MVRLSLAALMCFLMLFLSACNDASQEARFLEYMKCSSDVRPEYFSKRFLVEGVSDLMNARGDDSHVVSSVEKIYYWINFANKIKKITGMHANGLNDGLSVEFLFEDQSPGAIDVTYVKENGVWQMDSFTLKLKKEKRET